MPDDGNRKESVHQRLSQWYSQENGNRKNVSSTHAYIVSGVKIFTSLVAFLLIGLLLLWPIFFSPEETFNLKFSSIESDENETPVMLNPTFHGLDEKNQPFNIVAEEAIQEGENEVYLKSVSGDITLEDGRWISINSKEGRIKMDVKQAKLMGNVNIISDDGFEFTTNSADIDFDKNMANGNEPVVGQGPIGVLNSTGFSITENGNEILFKGPVKMLVYPGSGL